MKKIISVLLTLVLFISMGTTVFASEEPIHQDTANIEWKYTIYADENLEEIVETGVVPSQNARYSWGGVTLKNGQTVFFEPSHDYRGLYCEKGVQMHLKYTLSKSAYHESRLRAYVAGPDSELLRKITASGLSAYFTAKESDYYFGMITNLSSDSFKVMSFSITF